MIRHDATIRDTLNALASDAPDGVDASEWPLHTTKRLAGATQ